MEIKMFPASKIKQRLGLEHGGVVQKFFTNTCYKHMDKYVPKDEGNLRIVVSMDLNGNAITYESPYARYQYHGMREDGTHVVKNYTTAGTGPYWDKRMWSAEKDKVIRETEKYLRGKL